MSFSVRQFLFASSNSLSDGTALHFSLGNTIHGAIRSTDVVSNDFTECIAHSYADGCSCGCTISRSVSDANRYPYRGSNCIAVSNTVNVPHTGTNSEMQSRRNCD